MSWSGTEPGFDAQRQGAGAAGSRGTRVQILVAALVFSALSAATGPKHSRYQLCLDPCHAGHLGVPARLQPPSGNLACAEGCACHDDAHLWAPGQTQTSACPKPPPCPVWVSWAGQGMLISPPSLGLGELTHLLLQLRQTRTFPRQLRALLGRSAVCGVASWTARAP